MALVVVLILLEDDLFNQVYHWSNIHLTFMSLIVVLILSEDEIFNQVYHLPKNHLTYRSLIVVLILSEDDLFNLVSNNHITYSTCPWLTDWPHLIECFYFDQNYHSSYLSLLCRRSIAVSWSRVRWAGTQSAASLNSHWAAFSSWWSSGKERERRGSSSLRPQMTRRSAIW